MRLTCDTEVANRLLPSFNMKRKNKSRAQLSVGRKPGSASQQDSEIYLMICTSKDRSGQKYKLQGNIENFFNKFMNEGKATIRFKEPQHDIILSKADPVQLKSFMSVVRLGSLGKDVPKAALSTLAPASAKQIEKPKTKMIVLAKKDYPVQKGFPRELIHLQVSQCKLKRIDTRMFQLYDLKYLDLSNNVIQSLPENFGSVKTLQCLHLVDNQISSLPTGLCKGPLSESLSVLDLSGNSIKFLPDSFCQLTSLYSFRIDRNGLMYFPQKIGSLTNLRVLSATKNNLCCLPGSFAKLTLSSLDLFSNTLMDDGPSSVVSRLEAMTLLECAAKAIKKNKIMYTREDLPGALVDMLDNAKQCLCGQYCFRSFAHFLARLDLHRIAETVVNIDQMGRTHAPAESFLCSQHCLEKYRTNPYTFWS